MMPAGCLANTQALHQKYLCNIKTRIPPALNFCDFICLINEPAQIATSALRCMVIAKTSWENRSTNHLCMPF